MRTRAPSSQSSPNGAAGRLSELRVGKPDAAQGAQQQYAVEANHKRSWLARMVAAEVRSANRSQLTLLDPVLHLAASAVVRLSNTCPSRSRADLSP